jgi:tetratricopeptide (TPR) repeat protein
MGYYSAQAAQYEAVLASVDAVHLPRALETFDSALSREDTYSLILANHAMLLSQDGDRVKALNEISKAVANQPNDPRYWLIEGMIKEQASSDAEHVYIEALKLAPHWVGSSFWDKTDLRRAVRTAFLKEYGNADFNANQMANLPVQCWPRQPSTGEVNEQSSSFCEAVIEFRINQNRVGALMAINRAVELNATDPNLYLERAWINVALGKLAEAEKDARIVLFLGDSRGYGVLGAVLEESSQLDQAIENYSAGGPVVVRSQGWDVAVYLRRGDLSLLPVFDAPGPPRYDLTAWIRLFQLYVRLGRQTDADNVRNAILRVDPYFDVSELEVQP